MASFWSRPSWTVIHLYSLVLDLQDRNHKPEILKTLLNGFVVAMPCPECRKHLYQYMQENAIESSDEMFRYTFDLHNNVNEQQQKKTL